MTKVCSKCNQVLSFNCFYENSRMKDGYRSKCKECVKLETRENRLANLEYYRQYDRTRRPAHHIIKHGEYNTEKVCFKCGQLLHIDCFYKHSEMGDGYLNKCKECAKKDALEHRLDNLDKIRAYDRGRGNRNTTEDQKKYRIAYPNKTKARRKVAYAIRSNQLFSEPCEICGNEQTHAHHDDYLKPLNVRWLCAAHHRQWHVQNGEGRNG